MAHFTAPEVRRGRRVLREDVKEYLLDAILSGALKPGDRIIETRIAQQLGVSQGPVREALRDLELFGLVVSEPFRGTRVRESSSADLVEIYPIRSALEGVAARAAATTITDETLGRLESLLDGMRAAAERDDRKTYMDTDNEFHRTILIASGNRRLHQLWEGMRLHSSTLVSVTLVRRSLSELAERHVPILNALKAHDPDAAEHAIRQHIDEVADWVAAAAEADRRFTLDHPRGDDQPHNGPTER